MTTDKVIVLPYRQKGNQNEYLIKKELIEKWDPHPDVCSISFDVDDDKDKELLLKEVVEEILRNKININNLYNLGVCSESKESDQFYYLYCINVTNLDYKIDIDKYEFVDKERILNNIDSQLIVAYSRLEYLHLV
jgi:hypothetical protein